MVHLELTDEQAETLRQVLDAAVSDLGMEIANTDSLDYRRGLKRTQKLAMEMLETLEKQPA